MLATTRLGDPSVSLICLRQDTNGVLHPFCSLESSPIDLDIKPTQEQVRALRESMVAIARPKPLFHALIKKAVPQGWQESSHLRYARYAIFTDGKETIKDEKGKYTLYLDKEIGLTVINEKDLDTNEVD